MRNDFYLIFNDFKLIPSGRSKYCKNYLSSLSAVSSEGSASSRPVSQTPYSWQKDDEWGRMTQIIAKLRELMANVNKWENFMREFHFSNVY